MKFIFNHWFSGAICWFQWGDGFVKKWNNAGFCFASSNRVATLSSEDFSRSPGISRTIACRILSSGFLNVAGNARSGSFPPKRLGYSPWWITITIEFQHQNQQQRQQQQQQQEQEQEQTKRRHYPKVSNHQTPVVLQVPAPNFPIKSQSKSQDIPDFPKGRKSQHVFEVFFRQLVPIPCRYDIVTYIWIIYMVNVGEYTIHGCYGVYLTLILSCRMSTISF